MFALVFVFIWLFELSLIFRDLILLHDRVYYIQYYVIYYVSLLWLFQVTSVFIWNEIIYFIDFFSEGNDPLIPYNFIVFLTEP